MNKNKKISPLPFSIYYSFAVFLSLCGLADSIYLAIIHYRNYTDIGYMSFCAISRSINCDTVSQSPYAIFFGLPIAVWGIFGYLFLLFLLFFAAKPAAEKKRVWALLILVSFAFSTGSMVLAIISAFLIHSFCIMCIVSYGINFLLLYFTWLTRKRFDQSGIIEGLKRDIYFLWENNRLTGALIIVFLLMAISGILFFPKYWHYSLPPISVNMPRGLTEKGHPWIGSENPELVITEFVDYQCFQCNKMHYFLRQLLSDHNHKIRLVHRNYPMDHEFNPILNNQPFYIGSGKMALLSIYAAKKGKFWEMHDFLISHSFETGVINIKKLSTQVGLDYKELSRSLYDPEIRHLLMIDIRDGMRHGITGTPAYVINGNVYVGQIPLGIISE